MSGYAKACAYDRIRRLSRAGLDVAGFLQEAAAALGPAVPNGSPHVDGPAWYTLDPESLLITSSYGAEGCDLDTTAVMRWEYLDEDVNKYDEALRHPRGVQTLHEATGGVPERSRVYREYMASAGMAQEMLVALRAHTGECWGVVRMNRTFGEPEFDSTEIAFMATVSPHLAEGIRRGLLVGEAVEPDLPDAPGLVVLDGRGEIESLSGEAERWLELLPNETPRALPAAVAAVAAAATDRVGGDGPADGTTAQLRAVDGRWVRVHGMALSVGGQTRAAVILEPARPDRITPLLMALYGLTGREREVTRLVLHGSSTARLAAELRVSPLTVQQHLKSIFGKVGVHSRRELVARLFFDSFDPRVTDNARRTPLGRPIRGGPLPIS